jgi:hypothetical protein
VNQLYRHVDLKISEPQDTPDDTNLPDFNSMRDELLFVCREKEALVTQKMAQLKLN